MPSVVYRPPRVRNGAITVTKAKLPQLKIDKHVFPPPKEETDDQNDCV